MRSIVRIFCIMALSLGVVYALPSPLTSVVNLNQATEQQLLTLKGIGKKRAAAIVAYRQSHGKFQTLQELAAVPGMSKNLLDKVTQQNEHRVAL